LPDHRQTPTSAPRINAKTANGDDEVSLECDNVDEQCENGKHNGMLAASDKLAPYWMPAPHAAQTTAPARTS